MKKLLHFLVSLFLLIPMILYAWWPEPEKKKA